MVSLFTDQGRALRAWDPARGLSLENFVGFVAERQIASILRTAKRSPWTEDPTLEGDCCATPGPRCCRRPTSAREATPARGLPRRPRWCG